MELTERSEMWHMKYGWRGINQKKEYNIQHMAKVWNQDLVLTVQEAGWVPGLVWKRVENLTSLGLDPRTLQPVANHYTDYTILPTPQ
jgi:hypothetical protein